MQAAMKITRKVIGKMLLTAALLLLTVTTGSLAKADDQPGPLAISEDMSCGVCGMYPARFSKWQTQIIFTDGTMVPFDGSKDMFKYMFNMASYNQKHNRDDIAAIWVKDFANGTWTDGRKAVYVIGSKVMGPMGKELIPFSDGKIAGEFKLANDGIIKNLADISREDVKKLGMGGMKMQGKGKGKM